MDPNPSAQIIRHICDEKQYTKQLKSVISKYMCVIFALSQIIGYTTKYTWVDVFASPSDGDDRVELFFSKNNPPNNTVFHRFLFYRCFEMNFVQRHFTTSQRRINNSRCIPFFCAEFWFSVAAYPWSFFFPWFTISPTCLNHSHQPHPLCTSHKRTLSMLGFKSLNVWRHTLIHPFLWDYSKNCIKNRKNNTLFIWNISQLSEITQIHVSSSIQSNE